MSVAFAPLRQRAKGDITPAGIQKVISLNHFSSRMKPRVTAFASTLVGSAS